MWKCKEKHANNNPEIKEMKDTQEKWEVKRKSKEIRLNKECLVFKGSGKCHREEIHER